MFIKPAQGDKRLPPMDPVLLCAVLSLMAFGTIMIASTSLAISGVRYGASTQIIDKWLIYMPAALVVVWFLSRIDYARLSSFALPAMFASLVLLGMIFIPGVGGSFNGARRWISLGGISFQPVEMVKPLLIFYMANYLSVNQARLSSFVHGLLPMLIVLAVVDVLLLCQPDLGNAVLISATCFAMWLVGGVPLRHLVFLVISSLPLLAIAIIAEPYRVKRFLSYLDPWSDPHGAGYQLIQSMLAFGNGGLFGQGVGHGVQKLLYLPEVFTDFIGAGIAEEVGLLGFLFLIGAYALMALRSFYLAFRLDDVFKITLVVGAISFIIFSAAINLASIMTLIPTKGMPLPFVSYGGTALMGSSVLLGIIFAIQRSYIINVRRKK